MIILILGILLLLALASLNFIELKNNKTLIMAGIVMAMLLLNILEELTMPDPAASKFKALSNTHSSQQSLAHQQYPPPQYMLNSSVELFKKYPVRSLNKQQRTLLNTLLQKATTQKNNIKCILVFNNIEQARFRAVFKEFQHQLVENLPDQVHVEAIEVDYAVYPYQVDHLQTVFHGRKESGTPVMALVQGVSTLQELSELENLFLSHKEISLIFLNPPEQLFQLSSLSKWAQVFNFEGNYISQVLENHPPRLVEICSKYRTIDYSFYILSQSEPLSELCTKLPTNRVTECIRTHMNRADERIPYSRVRQCWQDGQVYDVQGVIFENGMVGLQKDYYYAGRVDKKEFMLEGEGDLPVDGDRREL